MVATKNQSCLLDYSPQNKYGTQEWFGLEDDFPFQTSDFACSTLVFQGCFSMSSCSQRLPMFCFHCSEDVHRTRQVPPIWGLTALPLVSPVVLSRDLPDPKKKNTGTPPWRVVHLWPLLWHCWYLVMYGEGYEHLGHFFFGRGCGTGL